MLGVEPIHRPTVRARLAEPLTSPPGKRTFARARMTVEDGTYVVTPVGGSGSHLIASLAQANAFAVVPRSREVAGRPATSSTTMLLERRA